MNAVAVGAFHDQVVDRRQCFGIANDRQSGTAEIAAEAQPDFASGILQFENWADPVSDMEATPHGATSARF